MHTNTLLFQSGNWCASRTRRLLLVRKQMSRKTRLIYQVVYWTALTINAVSSCPKPKVS